MAIIVTCPRCETQYEIEKDAIFKGVWRLQCPRCRGSPDARREPTDTQPAPPSNEHGEPRHANTTGGPHR